MTEAATGESVPVFAKDGLEFRKSSFSGTGGCVSIAYTESEVFIGDAKNPDGEVISCSLDLWRKLVAAAVAGELNYHEDAAALLAPGDEAA